jgi:hypothetical protein
MKSNFQRSGAAASVALEYRGTMPGQPYKGAVASQNALATNFAPAGLRHEFNPVPGLAAAPQRPGLTKVGPLGQHANRKRMASSHLQKGA